MVGVCGVSFGRSVCMVLWLIIRLLKIGTCAERLFDFRLTQCLAVGPGAKGATTSIVEEKAFAHVAAAPKASPSA